MTRFTLYGCNRVIAAIATIMPSEPLGSLDMPPHEPPLAASRGNLAGRVIGMPSIRGPSIYTPISAVSRIEKMSSGHEIFRPVLRILFVLCFFPVRDTHSSWLAGFLPPTFLSAGQPLDLDRVTEERADAYEKLVAIHEFRFDHPTQH